ncbi:MAG: hypothetical protein K2X01_03575 [Cyanobacteria bacterium]|nr:hypothetical protein [Cyanobacteriota bacterium]
MLTNTITNSKPITLPRFGDFRLTQNTQQSGRRPHISSDAALSRARALIEYAGWFSDSVSSAAEVEKVLIEALVLANSQPETLKAACDQLALHYGKLGSPNHMAKMEILFEWASQDMKWPLGEFLSAVSRGKTMIEGTLPTSPQRQAARELYQTLEQKRRLLDVAG